ncbi:MAG: hypothetical protein H7Y00_14010, partial [Fimbriimonadaceae bacterium]|nr:hypothetical protein [Chitinophagales bacterium]
MNYKIITLLYANIFCIQYICFSQDVHFQCPSVEIDYDKLYYFVINYAFEKTEEGYVTSDDTAQIPPYKKFKVIKPHGSYYVVKFIDTLQQDEFFVGKEIFDCNAIAAHARYFSFSVTTLPIKVRAFPKKYFDWE